MGYEFDFGWAFGGFIVMIIATLVLRFHQPIAEAMGAGMADYEKYKLYSFIGLVGGFLAMLNIIPLILYMVASAIFGGSGDTPPPTIEE